MKWNENDKNVLEQPCSGCGGLEGVYLYQSQNLTTNEIEMICAKCSDHNSNYNVKRWCLEHNKDCYKSKGYLEQKCNCIECKGSD